MKKIKYFLSLSLLLVISSVLLAGCCKKKEDVDTITLAEAKAIVLDAADKTYNKYHEQATISTMASAEGQKDVFACFKYVEFSGHADLDMSTGKHIEDFKTIIENNDGIFSRYTNELLVHENGVLTSEDYEYGDGENAYSYYKNSNRYIKNGLDEAGLGPNHRFVQYARMWLDEDGFEQRFKEGVQREKTDSGFKLTFGITLLDYITYSWDWSETTIEEFMEKYENNQRYKDCYSKLNPTLTIAFNSNGEFESFELYAKGQQFWDDDPVNYDYEHRCIIKPTSERVSEPAWFAGEHNWE